MSIKEKIQNYLDEKESLQEAIITGERVKELENNIKDYKDNFAEYSKKYDEAAILDTIDYFNKKGIKIDEKALRENRSIIGKLGLNSYFKIEKVIGNDMHMSLQLWGRPQDTKKMIELVSKINFKVK